MSNHILVIGGTGKTGRRVVEGLTQLNQQVRIGGRSQTPAFDWHDPSTFGPALAGIDRAYIVYYPDLAVPGAKEAIAALAEAAKTAGLQKVVLLSGKGEREAELCEEIIATSGLNYTLVRASWFSQNFSESFLLDPILAGQVFLPMPEAQIPFVDADDIAEAVVKVLLDDAYNGQTFEITGPRTLTFEEAVYEIAKGSGRSLQYQAISLAAYNEAMKGAGVPDDYIWLFDYLFREVLSKPSNQAISHDFERLIGRPATDFADFVQKTAPSGVWNQPMVQSV